MVDGVYERIVIQSATNFTLLEYMEIWCKIQVVINPLMSICVLFLNIYPME